MDITEEVISHLKNNIKTKIGVSSIHGVGVIAIRDIKKGEYVFPIWEHDTGIYLIPNDRLDELPKEVFKLLDMYFINEDCGYKVIRLFNGISLILMSTYNTDIRKSILEHIGKEAYTNILNKKTFINTSISPTKVEVTYIECNIYLGNIYDLIKDNHIDVTKVNNPEYNILSMFYKSISPLVQNIRNNFGNIIDYNIDNIHFNDLPNEIIDYFKEQKYNKINNIYPINYLFHGIQSDKTFMYNGIKLSSFAKSIYDINIIDNIAFNKKYPFEILFNILDYTENDFI